jgi:hypothetical protein
MRIANPGRRRSGPSLAERHRADIATYEHATEVLTLATALTLLVRDSELKSRSNKESNIASVTYIHDASSQRRRRERG